MQHHLISMASTTTTTISPALVSDRLGVENMDGQAILAGRTKSHARPWNGCIPFEQLSKNNLPPFYVRLQDDQVGHLAHWAVSSRDSIARHKLTQNWPWDFDGQGKIWAKRDSWGAGYSGPGKETGKGLSGGKKVPAWTDPGLPPTYTSSHKVMTRELASLEQGAARKRKEDEEAGRNVGMPVKKPRLGNMGAACKRMKDATEQKRHAAAAAKEKERYAGGTPQLRDALSAVDNLMQSATETEDRNAALERMLLQNEAQYERNTDDMFDEWRTYNEIKREEVNRMLASHAAEIKDRDAKIGALEVEAGSCRARLERAKRRVEGRDARLARAKNHWAREQEVMERKMQEMREVPVDLDELSAFDDEDCESESETEAYGVEVKAEHKQEPIDVQKTKEPEPPEPKEPTGRELMVGSVDQDPKKKTLDAKNPVGLNEDESEDEGPIKLQRNRDLRN